MPFRLRGQRLARERVAPTFFWLYFPRPVHLILSALSKLSIVAMTWQAVKPSRDPLARDNHPGKDH